MLKKIIMVSGIFLLSQNLFGVDLSKETSKEKSLKKDKATSNKTSVNKNDTTKTGTTSKSAFDKTANVEVDFYQYLIANPKVDECIFFTKTLKDFGVSSFNGADGYVDVNLQNYYEHISKANANISDAEMNVEKFKSYLKCIGREGANFAQTITNFGRDLKRRDAINEDDLNDEVVKEYSSASSNHKGNIKLILGNFEREVDRSECVFFGELGKIKCGGIAFSFPDNTLKYGELTLTSPQNFYGVTGKMTVAISTNLEKSKEISNETQIAKNKEETYTNTKSVNTAINNKKSISVGGFVPKD